MRLYVPTFQRVHQQETWSWLSGSAKERAVLVARPEESDALRALGYPVVSCPAKGIGPTRQWILDHHDVDRYGPRLMWLDDDLKFAKRRLDDPTKFLPLDRDSDDDWDAMEADFEEMLDFVPLCGLAARSGANRDAAPYKRNGRIYDLMAMDLNVVRQNGFRINRLEFMEDFDFSLQFLTRGYQTLLLNTHAKDDRGSNAPGGCSSYRTDAGQAQAAHRLAELWPGLVAVTERPPWRGSTVPRVDVRVQWAKAYEAGKSLRHLLGDELEPELSWATGSLERA